MEYEMFLQILKLWLISTVNGQMSNYEGKSGRTVDITMHRIVSSDRQADSLTNVQELKLQKFNRTTQILKGNFEAFADMDNSVSISFTIYKKAGNQYKTTPFRIPETKFCDWARDDTIFFGDIISHSDLPPKGSCPAVPKGKYFLSDFPFSTANIPSYFNGEFWVNEKLSRNGKVVDEINYYGEVTQYDKF